MPTAYVLEIVTCLACLRASMFTTLRAPMSYIFVMLKYLACLRACVLDILACPINFTFEKSISKNSYIEEFKNLFFIQRRILNLFGHVWWTLFAKKNEQLKAVNCFRRKALSQMFVWVINTPLVMLHWTHFLLTPILSLFIPI